MYIMIFLVDFYIISYTIKNMGIDKTFRHKKGQKYEKIH